LHKGNAKGNQKKSQPDIIECHEGIGFNLQDSGFLPKCQKKSLPEHPLIRRIFAAAKKID
jgi:hypothetical protein